MGRVIVDATLVAADLREVAADVITFLEDRVARLSDGDFVLLILAAFLISWVIASLRAVTRIGPIEVDVVAHDQPSEHAPEVQALTTLLRERLAHSGLSPPPQVPAGTPQTDLITAVESSTIPQGAWLAKLLQLLPTPPQPPRYQLSAALLHATPPASGPVGIRFWLRPTREGTALLSTVQAPNYGTAVHRAAAEIFVHISNDAVHVFPPWARWQNPQACEAYVDGVYAQRREGLDQAAACFAEADRKEPTNVLARLQLANIDELRAGNDPPKQAEVLRRYLDLAMDRTELVEPRYRASILAGVVATAIEPPAPAGEEQARAEAVSEIAAALRVTAPVSDRYLTKLLEDLAARESEAAFALLQPWYTLVSRQRPRHRFELQGFDRRRLMTTVRISRHCLAVRRLGDASATYDDARWELGARRFLVRIVHLLLGRAFCGWQAFYNAGCFYALLAERTDGDRAARLRDRAYRCLEHATEEAGDRLNAEWMLGHDPALGHDPDLDSLRASGDARWSLLRRRVLGEPLLLSGYPASPWVAPQLRRGAWNAIAAALVLAAVAALASRVLSGSSSWPAVAVTILCAALGARYARYRAGRAERETEFHHLRVT